MSKHVSVLLSNIDSSLYSCHDKSNAQLVEQEQAIECQERIRKDAKLNQIAEAKYLNAVPVNGDGECLFYFYATNKAHHARQNTCLLDNYNL